MATETPMVKESGVLNVNDTILQRPILITKGGDMKKYLIMALTLCITCSFIFAKGTCKDHGYYPGSYCPDCLYNKAKNKGSYNADHGQRYQDSFCNSSNNNKDKTCRDGYSEGYGEKEWCPKCKAYFPAGTHVHNKK